MAKTETAKTIRPRRQAETLLELREVLANGGSLNDILDILLEVTVKEVSADRVSLFLNDEAKEELFSRRTVGGLRGEIRIPNTSGIAGHVFMTGEAVIIDKAYDDERFNRSVDEDTGYQTHSLLCVPIREEGGKIIGVVQALNSKKGRFDDRDLGHLTRMAMQAAGILYQAHYEERVMPAFLRSLSSWLHGIFAGNDCGQGKGRSS